MTNYENLPLYAMNVKVFVKLGLIDSSDWTKRFLFSLILVITLVGLVVNMFKTWDEDIGETSMNIHKLLALTHCSIRCCIMVKKAKKFERLFQSIEQWYRDIEVGIRRHKLV